MVRITTELPSTGYQRPTDQELRQLAAIVYAAYPNNPPISERTFSLAMFAVGRMFRTVDTVSKLYFPAWVDIINTFLDTHDLPAIGGAGVFAAVIGHNDIPVRLGNSRYGQMLEIGLDQYAGAKCSNSWRGVLAGAPLLEPLPPRGVERRVEGRPIPHVRISQRGHDGLMHEIPDGRP